MSARLGACVLAAAAVACGSKDGKRASDDAGPAIATAPAPPVSKPGPATVAALKQVREPRALVFIPPGPVVDQVVGYLTDLGATGGVAFEVRELDRLIDIEEAKRFRVARDGVVVLLSGENFETIVVGGESVPAEDDLARLDGRVARALARLGRQRQTIGLVKHHVADVERYLAFENALAELGFDITLVVPGKDVPPGALAVFLDVGAGPTRPAMESIDRHLAAGGAALVAVEPRRGASLAPLESRLGLALAAGSLVDPEAHAVMRKDRSDLGLILTTEVAAHASTAGAGRLAAATGLLFPQGGTLIERGRPAGGATRAVTIRSPATAFVDLDRDSQRDGGEAVGRHPIASAVSGPCKAVVVADASWLADDVVRAAPANLVVLADAIRWLAGEEEMVKGTIDAPATGDRLTRYPLRQLAVPAARNALWKVAQSNVQAVRFESRGRTVLLERRDGELWGRVERPSQAGGGTVREFPLSPAASDLFAALAEPVPLRAVGPLDATTRARYGLEDGTLTVDIQGGVTHTVMIGSRVMTGYDRYAADPSARVVVILPSSLIDPLDQPDRLALRRVIDLDPKALTRLVVSRGDRTREAVRESGGTWRVANGGSEEAFLAEEIARAAFLLVPLDFARADKASALTAAGKVTFTAPGAPGVELEIYLGTGDEFWIATRLTRGLARVSAGSARRIAGAIDQLLGPG